MKARRPFRAPRLDWILAAAALALCGTGALLVWSATESRLLDSGDDPLTYLNRQLLNIAAGVAAMIVLTLTGHRTLRAYTPWAYLAACLALAAVLTPLGRTVNGAQAWLGLGPLQVQPSEPAKLALVLALAAVLAERGDGERRPTWRQVLPALALAAPPGLLILLQPDMGTLLILGAVVLGALFAAGVALRWPAALLVTAAAAGAAAWFLGLLQPHQVSRLIAFAEPGADPLGAGYTAKEALVTVGSGGTFGRGLFNGDQTAGRFVPEQHTDFVFTVAGEELGFLGSALIVALLAVVFWRGLRIAGRADSHGSVTAAAVVCWLAVQTFVNVGMALGLAPVIGVPLPLVSYGGSATVATLAAIGVLQSIHRGTQRL
ncbi:rod shape-determining protein RodA [Nonomuraea typhae]|uniref:rod shape-determining protein RodA n=1 Tax=Nonomuraea typhae TaxID=2603600 RepID=UPI0012F78C30|nr:rod shape-determining protein RodA [Nonomuraea typhae]